jgi:hypothetical protein
VYPAVLAIQLMAVTIRAGAGNQQERLESVLNVTSVPEAIGYYLAGFVDGEGSFNVSFRPRSDYVFPWKVSLCFNVSQRERALLEILQKSPRLRNDEATVGWGLVLRGQHLRRSDPERDSVL